MIRDDLCETRHTMTSDAVPEFAAASPSLAGVAPVAVPPPLEAWQRAPYLEWSMQHIADFLPVHPIARGSRVTPMPAAPADLGPVAVEHPWESRSASFDEVMAMSHTDGWVVTRHGAVIGERYFNTMAPTTPHLLMSVSKSLTTTTAGILIGDGILDPDGAVTAYVPALAGSGYDGATVRHLLDMRSGVRFSEDYLDPDAEVRLLEQAIGWAPRRSVEVPGTLIELLASLRIEHDHGGRFEYKSCETDALAFVIEGATGAHAADVMSRRLWQEMGAEFGAYVGIDSVGAAMFDGGVCAALRDLARFGSLYLREGAALDGRQVLPQAWITDTYQGGVDSRIAFANAPEPTLMPGGMYRNGFWFPYEGSEVMLALGIHGQMIYINRAAGVVAAKLSSWPSPQDGEKLLWTLRAFDAVSRALV